MKNQNNGGVILKTALEPADRERLASLCGPVEENLRHVERRLGVEITCRNENFSVAGPEGMAKKALRILREMYLETAPVRGGGVRDLTPEDVHLIISENVRLESGGAENAAENGETAGEIRTKKGIVRPRSRNQAEYVANILSHDISFGVGPAGTGKTYLAVAAAVDALERQQVRRIILTRPAVEAGEKLGFLPGDFHQKVDPYLRPLYDALFEMLGFERAEKLTEHQIIEVAPLAYMRGRTLNDSFIILDESQNTTVEQMKMFLTRIGFNSRAVITGDITQTDLPGHVTSGLRHALAALAGTEGISFTFFSPNDVVRHPVVARIVRAYEAYEQKTKNAKKDGTPARRGGSAVPAEPDGGEEKQ